VWKPGRACTKEPWDGGRPCRESLHGYCRARYAPDAARRHCRRSVGPRDQVHAENHIFGALPDELDDDWIDNIENLDAKLNEFIEKKRRASAFDIRYADTVDPKGEPWEKCAQVLSRRDIAERLSKGW
jgi:hypothetical protein